jgi:excisionase family DNA binding protein
MIDVLNGCGKALVFLVSIVDTAWVGDQLLSTGQVARLLGCSRQHVVDLCNDGRLPWVSAGAHRRVRQADVDRLIGRSLTRDQERSLWLHHAVAGRVVLDPSGVLERATRGLVRLQQTHSEGAVMESLQEWGRIIDAGPSRVLEALTSHDGRAVELRQNSPFAGVLTEVERTAVLTAFRDYWRRTRAA